jgi:thiaminase (transcriptional activator TenA)
VTFTDELRAASAGTWDAVLGHRFVAGLWAGRLEPAVLADYLVQEAQLLAQRSAPVSRGEANYLVRAMDALDVPLGERTDPELDEPVRELVELARSADPADRLTVLLAADWVRHDCADRPEAAAPTEPLQREWIELHRGTPFVAWVESQRRELDRTAAGLDDEGRDRIGALFARTAELELAFLDAVHP